jgi:hypothetical protein
MILTNIIPPTSQTCGRYCCGIPDKKRDVEDSFIEAKAYVQGRIPVLKVFGLEVAGPPLEAGF